MRTIKALLCAALLAVSLVLPTSAGAGEVTSHHARAPMRNPLTGMGPLTDDAMVAWLATNSTNGTKNAVAYSVGLQVTQETLPNTLTFEDAAFEIDLDLTGDTVRAGLWQDTFGLHWFTYADNTNIVCERGVLTFGSAGCQGAVGDLGVAFGTVTYVEILPGCPTCDVWYELFSQDRVNWTEVGSVLGGPGQGAFATRVVGEEQYFNQNTDPGVAMGEFMLLPQYLTVPGGSWIDWPASAHGVGLTFLDAEPATICPQPYAAYRFSTPRNWLVGNLLDPPARCSYSPLF